MQANQISMFDGNKPFKINKPIRLIELFAGYGSQALALKYLGVPFEHHKISEWAKELSELAALEAKLLKEEKE